MGNSCYPYTEQYFELNYFFKPLHACTTRLRSVFALKDDGGAASPVGAGHCSIIVASMCPFWLSIRFPTSFVMYHSMLSTYEPAIVHYRIQSGLFTCAGAGGSALDTWCTQQLNDARDKATQQITQTNSMIRHRALGKAQAASAVARQGVYDAAGSSANNAISPYS